MFSAGSAGPWRMKGISHDTVDPWCQPFIFSHFHSALNAVTGFVKNVSRARTGKSWAFFCAPCKACGIHGMAPAKSRSADALAACVALSHSRGSDTVACYAPPPSIMPGLWPATVVGAEAGLKRYKRRKFCGGCRSAAERKLCTKFNAPYVTGASPAACVAPAVEDCTTRRDLLSSVASFQALTAVLRPPLPGGGGTQTPEIRFLSGNAVALNQERHFAAQ